MPRAVPRLTADYLLGLARCPRSIPIGPRYPFRLCGQFFDENKWIAQQIWINSRRTEKKTPRSSHAPHPRQSPGRSACWPRTGSAASASAQRVSGPWRQLARGISPRSGASLAPGAGARPWFPRASACVICGQIGPNIFRPKFELVKKRDAAPIYIYIKKTNYFVRFASPSRCRVLPASYTSAMTYFSLVSLPRQRVTTVST
jgi:hypothetical protein